MLAPLVAQTSIAAVRAVAERDQEMRPEPQEPSLEQLQPEKNVTQGVWDTSTVSKISSELDEKPRFEPYAAGGHDMDSVAHDA